MWVKNKAMNEAGALFEGAANALGEPSLAVRVDALNEDVRTLRDMMQRFAAQGRLLEQRIKDLEAVMNG